MAKISPVNLPPAEAVAWFRRKGYQISFGWEDTYADEHAHAFTVAKAMSVDLLEDIRSAVDKALSDGTTLRDFQKELEPLLVKKGWWGRKTMIDPVTGEERDFQLGSPRRLATIYDTNLRTSYAAGRWENIERTKSRRPYLRYVAILDERTRDQHRTWHGTVLPVDHPWWKTHYPPNGWGCRCSVQQLSERDLDRFGYKVSAGPPDVGLTRTWTNPRSGETRQIPVGIDPGWEYHVGLAGTDHAQAIRAFSEKAAAAGADIGAAAWNLLTSEERRALEAEFAEWADALAEKRVRPQGALRHVGTLSPNTVDFLRSRGTEPASAMVSIVDHRLIHLARDAKAEVGKVVDWDQVRKLPMHLANPKAVLWDKTKPNTVLFVFEAPGEERLGKYVVRVNYQTKLKGAEKKTRAILNSIRTAGLVKHEELIRKAVYELIEGAL